MVGRGITVVSRSYLTRNLTHYTRSDARATRPAALFPSLTLAVKRVERVVNLAPDEVDVDAPPGREIRLPSAISRTRAEPGAASTTGLHSPHYGPWLGLLARSTVAEAAEALRRLLAAMEARGEIDADDPKGGP